MAFPSAAPSSAASSPANPGPSVSAGTAAPVGPSGPMTAAAMAAAAAMTGPPAGSPVPVPTSSAPVSAVSAAPRKLSGRRRRETVAVLIFGGAPIFESSIPLSVFGVDRQDAGVPRYRLLVCAGEEGPLPTTGGLTLTAPYGLEALSRAGTIVVPAWRSISQPPPVEAIAALRKAHHEGARIIGLCTGAFVLAAAGLLDGRPATTHWMYAPTLAKRYPRVHVDPRELFVDDGDVLTSAGTAAGIDLCLHVVRSDHGAEAANALARRLVVPSRRSGGGQAQYIDQSLPEEIGNDPLAEVVTWALENLNQQFDVEVLAARAYMSRRTFDRRFRTLTGSAPLQWLITQRVLQAQRLLETSDLSVDDVARRCGFRSPVALRGHFRRQLGVSPAAYRTTYRARRPGPGTPGAAQGANPQAERLAGSPVGPPGQFGQSWPGGQGGQAGPTGPTGSAGQNGPAGPGTAHAHLQAGGASGHSHGVAPTPGQPAGQPSPASVPHQQPHTRQPYQSHPALPVPGGRGSGRLVPSQAGPGTARPARTAEHAPAEDGQPQPGARGQGTGQGHRAGRGPLDGDSPGRPAADRSVPDRPSGERSAARAAGNVRTDQAGSGRATPAQPVGQSATVCAGRAGRGSEDGAADDCAPSADRIPAPASPPDDEIGGSAPRTGLPIPAARDRAVG